AGSSTASVGPRESPALTMSIPEALSPSAELARRRRAGGEPERARLDRLCGERWDYLRWFLGLHYRFNARLDTPFWQECRRRVDVSGLDEWLARYRAAGPLTAQGVAKDERGAVFGPRGVDVMLLGQEGPCPLPAPPPPPGAWAPRRPAPRRLGARGPQ